jgi:hypothetical protein
VDLGGQLTETLFYTMEKERGHCTASVSHTTKPTQQSRPELTENEIKRFYNCPQPVAALLLGVSLSSLKRRYYEICRANGADQGRRWPYQSLTIKVR